MDRVARQPLAAELKPFEQVIDYVNDLAPLEWTFTGDVIVRRRDVEVRLNGTLKWSGHGGTAILKGVDREAAALQNPVPYGTTLQEEDFLTLHSVDGDWQARQGYVARTTHHFNAAQKAAWADITIEFMVLEMGNAHAETTDNALLLADIDFVMYPTVFPIREGDALDGMIVELFGRPAIIRKVPNQTSREPFLIVVYNGAALTNEECKDVWLTVSFLAGRTGAIAGKFGINGNREVYRVLERYEPDANPARPPVNWLLPVTLQPLRQLPPQISTMLSAMNRLRTIENIPVDVALAHLLSRVRYFDMEVRDITLALDSLIEADAFSRRSATLVDPAAYTEALPDLHKALETVIQERKFPEGLLSRIDERLRGANDISHGERRRAFFQRVGFEPGPREKGALDLRHIVSHRGYLWRDGDGRERLDGISEQTRIARTFVNSVILSLLGYRGLVLDYLMGANLPMPLRR